MTAADEIAVGARGWRAVLADLLFSRNCEGCGRPLDCEPGAYCWECRAELPAVTVPYCRRCGDPAPGEASGDYDCAACTERAPAFDWARSAMHYRGAVQRAVRDFKYHGALWLQEEFAGWLEALWGTCPEDRRAATAVVPVPMHRRRMRARGYNQARLLAEAFARRAGLPCRPRWLARVRATPTQTRLTARGRAENVRGCFAAGWRAPLEGARVVLVDDVMTTGATLDECAKTLKRAGAAWVAALTVARGG